MIDEEIRLVRVEGYSHLFHRHPFRCSNYVTSLLVEHVHGFTSQFCGMPHYVDLTVNKEADRGRSLHG